MSWVGTNEKGSHESMTVGTGRWAHGFIIPSLYFCMFENFPKYKENNKNIYKERNICANFTSRSWSISCIFPCVSWIVCIVLNDFFFFKFVFLPFLFIVYFPFRKPSFFCNQWSNRNGITNGRLEKWGILLFLVYSILQRTH